MTDFGSMLLHALKQVLSSSKGVQNVYHPFVITNILKPVDNRLSGGDFTDDALYIFL